MKARVSEAVEMHGLVQVPWTEGLLDGTIDRGVPAPPRKVRFWALHTRGIEGTF